MTTHRRIKSHSSDSFFRTSQRIYGHTSYQVELYDKEIIGQFAFASTNFRILVVLQRVLRKMTTNKLDLDAASRQFAEIELDETPAIKDNQIAAIQKWIHSHEWLTCRTDSEFILRFLRVEKFNLDKAKERIEKFCIVRTSKIDGVPQWCQNQDNQEIRKILETGCCYPLREPDENGCLVLFQKWGLVANCDQEMVGRAAVLMFDYVSIKYPRTQINGIRFLDDKRGHSVDQMLYWNLKIVQKAYVMMQQALPFRITRMDWYRS